MRFVTSTALAVLAVLATSCGGPRGAPAASAAPLVPVRDLPATRWVPANPTYVFGSRSVEVAQGSLRDAIELVGSLAGFDLAEVVLAISATLAVDALHADPVAAIGVDARASWAVFSDDLAPTLVIHLAAPALMTAFLAHQRERGLTIRSVVVGGTEVFSASIGPVALSWAIAGDWMWIHISAQPDVGARWFTASHEPHAAAWLDSWAWAQRAAGTAARVVGFLELRGAVASAIARAPEALACTRLIAQAGRIAVALEGNGQDVAARVAVEVGATDAIRAQILPPPSGWDATAAGAPIALQWNLDISGLRSWLRPCGGLFGEDVAALGATGARSVRAVVLDFDPDAKSGRGAIAFDVTGPGYFTRQLDRIPLRGTLERPRAFGSHKGFAIAIPFAVTIEYVLEDRLVLGALGEGVLARLVAPHPAVPPIDPPGPTGRAGSIPRDSAAPIFALDLAPPAMSARAWATAIHAGFEHALSGTPGPTTRRIADRLQRWRDIHIAIAAEPTAVVLTISGHRR